MTDAHPAPDETLAGPEPPAPDPETVRAALAAAEAERDHAIAARDAALAEREQEQAAMLTRLRAALLAGDPLVPAELVHGTTAEEIEASFAAAQAAITRVRDELSTTPDAGGGAPGRATTSSATPFEKIRSGLARKTEA